MHSRTMHIISLQYFISPPVPCGVALYKHVSGVGRSSELALAFPILEHHRGLDDDHNSTTMQ